jgi:hypothetical protein
MLVIACTHSTRGWVDPRTGQGGCGFDLRTVQPVAERYTDCAILFQAGSLSQACSQHRNLKHPDNENSARTVEKGRRGIQVLWEEKSCRMGNTDLSMDYSALTIKIKRFPDLLLVLFALKINAL